MGTRNGEENQKGRTVIRLIVTMLAAVARGPTLIELVDNLVAKTPAKPFRMKKNIDTAGFAGSRPPTSRTHATAINGASGIGALVAAS